VIETLARRIIRLNPWQLGSSLAEVFDYDTYYAIQRIIEEHKDDYAWINYIRAISELPRVKAWCEEHKLAQYHVVSVLAEGGVL